MKNKLFSICLVLAMFFLCLPVLPQADAADERKTGYLSNLAVQSFIEEQVIARLYDTTGQYHDYKFAEYVRLTIETGGTKKYNRDAQGLYRLLRHTKIPAANFCWMRTAQLAKYGAVLKRLLTKMSATIRKQVRLAVTRQQKGCLCTL